MRIELNHDEMARMLRAEGEYRGLGEDLVRRGRAIATEAGPGVEVETFTGAERFRVTVFTDTFEARQAEATDRTLTRALDAGRG